MGKELLGKEPVFYETVASLDRIVQAELSLSPLTCLYNGQFDLGYAGPVLTTILQIATTALLAAKGVTPTAVIGFSLGEIAAAVAAEALTAEEGVFVACKLAKPYMHMAGKGKMVIIHDQIGSGNTISNDVSTLLRDGTTVATIDLAPDWCGISGPIDTVDKFLESNTGRFDEAKDIEVNMAYHSPMLYCLRVFLENLFSDIILQPEEPKIAMYSTSSTNPRSDSLRDSQLFVALTLSPVFLTPAVKAAAEDGFRAFLDVSPSSDLSFFIKSTLATVLDRSEHCVVVSTLKKPTSLQEWSSLEGLATAVAKIRRNGVAMDWKEPFAGYDWLQMLEEIPEDPAKSIEKVEDWVD
ncbi:hypothetical protein MMC21_003312 [Puttea exsequens]|nr:hypothetical protein [Puttea exsequens]